MKKTRKTKRNTKNVSSTKTWNKSNKNNRTRAVLTTAELHEAGDDNNGEGEELGAREDVLHAGSPLHVPAVYEGQHHCRERGRKGGQSLVYISNLM